MSNMNDTTASVHYHSYLALDEILAAQRPRSEEHDEVLFIVIHQVYELWFKQVLHELSYLQRELEADHASRGLQTLKRLRMIFKTLVAQLDVLETLTPVQYAGFRDQLEASSGFQSAQFRELEATIGRREPRVLEHYAADSPARARIEAAMARRPLYGSFLRYLAARGYEIPAAALERDPGVAAEPSEAIQDVLVSVYRDDGEAAQVCEQMVDLDEGIQEWRYRHVKMVERTIGHKIGTGGSAGAAYLRTTLFQPAFPDLWDVRSRL
ncbi:MAG: tryptophan 2,3-dioxygenase [Actinobacteria bacterium]|nr:tryptophan 2,3-dioxygenase [Actinomycetota bacterium]